MKVVVSVSMENIQYLFNMTQWCVNDIDSHVNVKNFGHGLRLETCFFDPISDQEMGGNKDPTSDQSNGGYIKNGPILELSVGNEGRPDTRP